MLFKHLSDQFRGLLSARAVGKGHCFSCKAHRYVISIQFIFQRLYRYHAEQAPSDDTMQAPTGCSGVHALP